MSQTDAVDTGRVEEFGERMVGAINDAALVVMTSVGHRVGLFDTMAGLEPSTSDGIATAAGLEERYVREWLGTMVTAGVVDYDPESRTYALPAEHAAALTRAAGADNVAAFAAYVPMFAGVEDEVVRCFREGGGVPYSSYPRLQEVLGEDSGAVIDATLIDAALPLVPGLVDRLRDGIAVADFGCGAGHAINVMADAFPASRFVGYDISEHGLEMGRREAEEMGLENARFEIQDLATLSERDAFDFVTAFDVIHDQAKPAEVLDAIAASLRPDGTFLMVDIDASSKLEENVDHPIAPTLYMISTMHCTPVSLADDGAGLGTVWGRQKALEMLAAAGFDQVEVKNVEGDVVDAYYVAQRG